MDEKVDPVTADEIAIEIQSYLSKVYVRILTIVHLFGAKIVHWLYTFYMRVF